MKIIVIRIQFTQAHMHLVSVENQWGILTSKYYVGVDQA